jgi:hypothetical protein
LTRESHRNQNNGTYQHVHPNGKYDTPLFHTQFESSNWLELPRDEVVPADSHAMLQCCFDGQQSKVPSLDHCA